MTRPCSVTSKKHRESHFTYRPGRIIEAASNCRGGAWALEGQAKAKRTPTHTRTEGVLSPSTSMAGTWEKEMVTALQFVQLLEYNFIKIPWTRYLSLVSVLRSLLSVSISLSLFPFIFPLDSLRLLAVEETFP